MSRWAPLLLFLASAGCAPKPAPLRMLGYGDRLIGDSVAQYVKRDGKVAAVVWSDFAGHDHTGDVHGGRHESTGGRRVEWRYPGQEIGGPITINGREYQTSAGRVFLVRTRGEGQGVRQLDLDPGAGADDIEALARTVKDV